MWETWVRSLGWEDPLEKGKATQSSILVENSRECMVPGLTKSRTRPSDVRSLKGSAPGRRRGQPRGHWRLDRTHLAWGRSHTRSHGLRCKYFISVTMVPHRTTVARNVIIQIDSQLLTPHPCPRRDAGPGGLPGLEGGRLPKARGWGQGTRRAGPPGFHPCPASGWTLGPGTPAFAGGSWSPG